jgi:hypothetical protein
VREGGLHSLVAIVMDAVVAMCVSFRGIGSAALKTVGIATSQRMRFVEDVAQVREILPFLQSRSYRYIH